MSNEAKLTSKANFDAKIQVHDDKPDSLVNDLSKELEEIKSDYQTLTQTTKTEHDHSLDQK